MPDLQDGESIEMQGSGPKPYVLMNVGGVYSCSCPAWRNQSVAIERRTCKHLRRLRSDGAEETRIGGALPAQPQVTVGAVEGDNGLSSWFVSAILGYPAGPRSVGHGNGLPAEAGSTTGFFGVQTALPTAGRYA
jgi:hypothetical protein